MPDDGLIAIQSPHAVKDTTDRLEAELAARGICVFARIDHAAGAALANLALRPTQLLIFGSAKGGTPLMQAAQRSAIDLPLKMLCWQDEAGDVWLAYSDMQWLADRHGLAVAAAPAIAALTRLLASVASAAVA